MESDTPSPVLNPQTSTVKTQRFSLVLNTLKNASHFLSSGITYVSQQQITELRELKDADVPEEDINKAIFGLKCSSNPRAFNGPEGEDRTVPVTIENGEHPHIHFYPEHTKLPRMYLYL